MKKLIALVYSILLVVSACGGSNASCDYDISTATNGPTGPTATSYWNCLNASGSRWLFSIFDNGSGIERISGYDIAVTWDETGCREANVVDAGGSTQVTDIAGSISSGVLTFTLIDGNTGDETTSSCLLVTL